MVARSPATGETNAPFVGTRVLDFTHILAGPYCTRLLADLGADVVKVESKLRPDSLGAGTFKPGFEDRQDRPAAYLISNRSKHSITINLKMDRGRELATDLARVADVVIENFSAGVMARLGLGYEPLAAVNPRLVYVSMAGFGQEGPRRDWVSMNVNLQGYTGLMMSAGAEGDPPVAIGNSWCDFIAGLHAAFGITQALLDRQQTGRGANLDLSQFECNVSLLGAPLLASIVNRTAPPRRTNRSPDIAPQGCYPCAGKDEWCAVSVQTDEQWRALGRVLGDPAWAIDAELATVVGRLHHHDLIDRYIAEWTQQRAPAEAERLLQAAGVPAACMRRTQDLVDAPDASGVFQPVPEPRIEEIITPMFPFNSSLGPFVPPQPAPSLGEHTGDVLRGWLDLPEEAIRELEASGALV